MFKSIRLIFYIVLAVVIVITVQIHKGKIIALRKATPPSVLGILADKGVPVETFTVTEKNVIERMNTTLEKCGSQYCFYLSRKAGRNLKKGEPVFEVGENNKIGSIVSVAGADSITGLVKATVKLNKKLENEKSDFYVVSVGVNETKNVLAVPTKSIEYGADETFVWFFNEGKPKKQKVVLGTQGEDFAQVKSGVNKGDVVIQSGQGLLYQYSKAFQIQKSEVDVSASN